MTSLLCLLTLILIFIIIILILRLVSIRRAADELRETFAEQLKSDTNVGITISTSDKKMRSLAADMDRQLKLLRKAQLNYMQGDRELKAALEETAAAYYGALKNAGIEPQIYMPESEVCRLLNRQALMRILANLMDNAIKYSNDNLSITLSAEGSIIFRNRADTLDELTAGRLFDRFFTVESGERSTGLGLSIAKTLTEKMGGSVKADFRDGFLSITLYFPVN